MKVAASAVQASAQPAICSLNGFIAFMCVERGLEVGQIQAELHVEGASGLLQAVVVVELLVGEVGTLQADAVASVVHRVAHRGIVCELGRDILLACRPSQTGKAQVVLVDIVARVVNGERVAARQEVAEAVARVAIDEEVRDVRHPLPVRDAPTWKRLS